MVLRGRWQRYSHGAVPGDPGERPLGAMDMVIVDRIVDGRIVEHFALFDAMALMQQIGAIPGSRSGPRISRDRACRAGIG